MKRLIVLLLVAVAAGAAFADGRATSAAPTVVAEPVAPAEYSSDPHSDFFGERSPLDKNPVRDAGNLTWTFGVPCSAGISRLAAVVARNKLHIVTGELSGGGRAWQFVFDFATGAWSSGLAHPGGGISNADAVAVSDSLIIVGGGYNASAQMYENVTRLDLAANTWTAAAAMPQAGCLYYAMAAAGGNAYIFGGVLNQATVVNTASRYNVATNDFTTLAPMPLALRSVAAATVGDTIYLIGGHAVAGTPYNGTTNFLKYSISGNNWSTGTALPFAMTWGRAVAYNDPADGWVIYAFGGYNASGVITGQAWAYTVATRTWEQCNSLATVRRSHGGAIYRDTVLAVCGFNTAFINSVERGAIERQAPGELEAMWISADDGMAPGFVADLAALGTNVTLFDGRTGTPTISELLTYDAAGAHSNYVFHNPDGLGNVLADFADSAGGVVLATFCHASGWNIAGRVQTGNYATIGLGSVQNGTFAPGWTNPVHPIMSGVGALTVDFISSSGFVTSDSVAKWNSGNAYVGVSANRKVVAVNSYPGSAGTQTGDWLLVIHNALWYAAGRSTGVEQFDPLRPALNVSLDAAPSPAARQVTVSYAVAGGRPLTLGVYDAGGRLVKALYSGAARSGVNRVTWNLTDDAGRPVKAGSYFCRLDCGGTTQTRKVVVQ